MNPMQTNGPSHGLGSQHSCDYSKSFKSSNKKPPHVAKHLLPTTLGTDRVWTDMQGGRGATLEDRKEDLSPSGAVGKVSGAACSPDVQLPKILPRDPRLPQSSTGFLNIAASQAIVFVGRLGGSHLTPYDGRHICSLRVRPCL